MSPIARKYPELISASRILTRSNSGHDADPLHYRRVLLHARRRACSTFEHGVERSSDASIDDRTGDGVKNDRFPGAILSANTPSIQRVPSHDFPSAVFSLQPPPFLFTRLHSLG